MPREHAEPKQESITFRLGADLKAALVQAAAEERRAPAALLRALVRRHLDDRARRDFESEARRQSLAIARRAGHPATDEARVLRELEAEFDADAFAGEWKG